MIEWLKGQDWYWSLYFEWGFQPAWLPKPHLREWHVLVLPGMDVPPTTLGYEQIVARLSADQVRAMLSCPQAPNRR